jgi:hypothetical protein
VGIQVLVALAATAEVGRAQDAPTPPVTQNEPSTAASTGLFLLGAGTAFAAHEGGHLLFDAIFDAKPFVKSVSFGPVPFFAVSHEPISPREEFVVSSAGFWTQQATSEWLLTRHPGIREEHAPFSKGVLAFDLLTAIGYGTVAMFKAGPVERDTRGMASAIGVDERLIGVLVMAPAILDGYRYVRPGSRWAPWTSRAVKIGSVLLVLKQTSSDRR